MPKTCPRITTSIHHPAFKSTIPGRMTDFLTTFPDIRFCCKWLHFVITKPKDEVGCMAKSRTFFWRGVLILVTGRSSTNVTAQKSSHVAHLMRIIKVHVISEAYIYRPLEITREQIYPFKPKSYRRILILGRTSVLAGGF